MKNVIIAMVKADLTKKLVLLVEERVELLVNKEVFSAFFKPKLLVMNVEVLGKLLKEYVANVMELEVLKRKKI